MVRIPWVIHILFPLAFSVATALAADEPALPPPASTKIDFARDIQPILAARCIECHNPAKHKGEFRLDSRANAMLGGNSGAVIVPGKSAESLLIHNVARIKDATPMPPSGDPLTPDQLGLLRAWIDQGAAWPDGAAPGGVHPGPDSAGGAAAGNAKPHIIHADKLDHWSFQPPVRSELPALVDADWARNPIDTFVKARLEKEGLPPSPEAARAALLRRLSLDLTGLPPTPEELDAFAADGSPDAYDKQVGRLLDSPHYGERWARLWLDAARYADTNGYEKDRTRSIWAWRDWVIRAFNANMPFDRFTIEQIAGDMLPNPTRDQIVATGFHRNTMINEEGGIDVEQWRYEAVVDRVATTGTVFLGLTTGCAQCHDHKYDPISHREYFQLFAYLNSADEPELEVPTEKEIEARGEALARLAAMKTALPEVFPTHEETTAWTVMDPAGYSAAGGALLKKEEDKSLLAFGLNPDKNVYTITVDVENTTIDAVRLEALTHDKLPNKGPGRTPHGNFVLSEIRLTAAGSDGAASRDLKFASAEADFSQKGFPAEKAIDGNAATGWAIADGPGGTNQNRALTLRLAAPLRVEGKTRLTFTLDQAHGLKHTLGRFRLSAGTIVRKNYHPELAEAEQRTRHLEEKFAAWEREKTAKARAWDHAGLTVFTSANKATMERLADGSILVSGDKPNRDDYTVELVVGAGAGPIRGMRIEAMTDPSLPAGGPGRGDLMGVGNFMINEMHIEAWPLNPSDDAPGTTVTIASASADYGEPGKTAAQAIDGVLDTGWAIGGGEGRPHQIVFEFKDEVGHPGGTRIRATIIQHYIHQVTLGRFRVSLTTGERPIAATGMIGEAEAALLKPEAARTEEERQLVRGRFLMTTPELANSQREIEAARKALPSPPTTMVMRERAAPRKTHVHPRGEFLRTGVEVAPGTPAFLPPPSADSPLDRLTLARWIVDARNPLTARVTVNRFWAALFGRGLVATPDDFGTRSEPPTHPALMDWLATEFVATGWDVKGLLRMIVTSAAYRQASRATPELLARDPENVLLARGPRFRVEAEMVRDLALSVGGLLNDKIGGPSVYPPQPGGVWELSYGSPKYPASMGEDRYRRGLYTFWKRSAPYAAFATFDAPSRERSCVVRTKSNTPLQALTLLNDEVFVDAARGLARRVLALGGAGSVEAKARHAFRICTAREPEPGETGSLAAFLERRMEDFRAGRAEAAKVALADGEKPPEGADLNELAAWTEVSRVLLNLDETVTKE